MAAIARALPFAANVEPLYRGVAVGAIAGALAGVLVGGIGGRIAMRLAGAMSDPSMVGGARTANGNILGDVTLGGTLAIVIFAGLLPGTIGGLAFVAARPWLAPLGRWGGLAFGLVLLSSIGPTVLEPFNFDFRKFGSAPVNVATFALLFPLFGIALGALIGPVERRIGAPRGWIWELVAIAGVLFAALIFVVAAGALFAAVTRGAGIDDPRGFLLVYLLAAPAVLRVILGRGRSLTNARDLDTVPRVVSYALLLAPAALGLPSTVDAISFLAR
jgi:hypothetical protein